jgi:hypothetical protein
MRDAVVYAVLAAIVLIFFSDVIFGDRVLITSNPAYLEPWSSYAGQEDFEGKSYRMDALLTYFPRRVELTRSIRQGRIPLWNPYLFCGTPFFADPQSRVLYPVSLLLVLCDPLDAMGYDIAIHFFIAMVGMYLFLRIIGATRAGSFTAALLYAFSSFFFLRMGHPTFVASASWIPFLFYAYEKARLSERTGTLLLVVFSVMGYLAGFPQVFLLGALALGVYVLHDFANCLLGGRTGAALRDLRVLLVSGLLSAAVVSVQLIPFAEFIRNSVGLGMDSKIMEGLHIWGPVFQLRSVFPGIFGNPVEGTNWLLILKQGLHQYNTGFMVYCGAGSVALAAAGLPLAGASRPLRGLYLVLALAVGVATSAALLGFARTLIPLLSYSQIDRVAVIACFALAAAAGFTFSELTSGRARTYRRFIIPVTALLLVAVLVGGAVFIAKGGSLIERLATRAESMGSEEWLRTSSLEVRSWVYGGEAHWFTYEKAQVFRGMFFFALPSVFILILVGAGPGRRGTAALIGVLLFTCLACDVLLTSRDYYVSQNRRLFSDTEGVRFLERAEAEPGRWRAAALVDPHLVLPVNIPQVFGLYHLDGRLTIMPEAHAELLAKRTWMPEVISEIGDSVSTADMLFAHDMGCARYMLAPDIIPGVPVDQYRPVYDGDMTVYENLRARDKGFCVPLSAFGAAGADREHARVARFLADPRRRSNGSVDIVSYEPETVELSVSLPSASLMVFQDTYYPGWKAYVDGAEQPVLRTDLGFRGLEIEKGRHRVVMHYRPNSLIIGLIISSAGIILSLIYGIKAKAQVKT